ncbi:trigger factor [Streptococcus pneumoniae]|nr:trigger factor [Streptococcus pneumoniae]OKQ21024.1 trigger factor [Streptococcus pneumoniae WU2] [Streptococcus pneumoniae]OKQ29299.1 trigger factor [Streptococcus pneumoniae]OKQ47781.1 trigger factor [Streptococcus pneumoniae]
MSLIFVVIYKVKEARQKVFKIGKRQPIGCSKILIGCPLLWKALLDFLLRLSF